LSEQVGLCITFLAVLAFCKIPFSLSVAHLPTVDCLGT